MKKVILVAGRARHGKDSFAMECSMKLDCDIFEISSDLWDCVATAFNLDRDTIVDNKDEEVVSVQDKKFTLRHFAQFFGNEIVPNLLGKYAWCSIIQNKILSSDKDIIFITGIRLLKEEHFFRQINPNIEVIKIERVNEDGSVYCGVTKEDNEHPTEKEVDLIGYDKIFTHCPLEQLEKNARDYANNLKNQEQWI